MSRHVVSNLMALAAILALAACDDDGSGPEATADAAQTADAAPDGGEDPAGEPDAGPVDVGIEIDARAEADAAASNGDFDDIVVVDGRPEGWAAESHSNDVDPQYDVVFDPDRVHRLDLTIEPAVYAAMRAEIEEIAGGFGGGGPGGPGGGPGGEPPGPPEELIAACEGLAAGDACAGELDGQAFEGTCESLFGSLLCLPEGGPGGPGGPGGGPGGDPGGPGGGVDLVAEDPSWFPVDVRADGLTWYGVGMRFKGNSSLAASVGSGVEKLPFRLDFDEFEDDFPPIDDQRFFGFKKLTFSPGWGDDCSLRDRLANELLADRGLAAPRTAFVAVWIDVGEGPQYYGLTTMIEDPSDAMLDRVFGDDGGNLYKPEGVGADWTVFDPEGFVKKTNEDDADWSDIEAAVMALHADRADEAAWRAGLEATLDVETFLRWLAMNTVMVNWDVYGGIAHNYYLYGDPALDGRLVWMPWDQNLSMQSEGGFGGPGGRAGASLDHEGVGDQWPLISWLLADPVYRALYVDLVAESIEGAFSVEAFQARVDALAAQARPWLFGPEAVESAPFTHQGTAEQFDAAVERLRAHVEARHEAVAEFLAAEGR